MSKDSSVRYAQRVVQVVVYGKTLSAKFPVLNEQPGRARGSGFFVRFPGDQKVPRYILTAAHVVEDAFTENGVKVILPLFGQQEIPAQVRAIVPEIDLAVLEIDPTGKEKFIDAFEVGDDHELEFGSDVPLLVLGYPLGQEQLKVLRCNFSGRQDVGIQTDCALNKGNSGGPIVFKDKIVGWVSSGVPSSIANNISWAVPINQFKALLPLIIKAIHDNASPVIHAPHAGLMYHNSSVANSNDECQGVVIQFVSAYSVLSDIARPGDKLCSVEFKGQVYKLDHRGEVSVPWYFSKLPFSQIAAEIPADEPVTFHLWDKDTHQFKHKTTLLNVPNHGGYMVQSLRYEPLDYEMFAGLMVMPLRGNHFNDFPQLRATLQPSEREADWLLVTHTVPGSEVYETGVLNPGDLLTKVNDVPVHTLDELRAAVLKGYTSISGRPAVKFETRENSSIVLDLNDVLKNEDVYQRQNGTRPSLLVEKLSHQSA